MNKKTTLILGAIALVILLGAIVFFFYSSKTKAPVAQTPLNSQPVSQTNVSP